MEFSLINLFAVLLAAWVLGGIVSRLGYPSILGELAAGIIFGPPLLGLLEDQAGLRVLAEVGVYLLMLYIGMQVDHRELRRASWPGLLAAIGGFSIPFAAGFGLALGFGADVPESMFLGLGFGVTALVAGSRILADFNLFGTRIANVLLASALIADTAALLIFAGILSFARTGGVDVLEIATVGGKAVLFFGIAAFLGLKVFPIVGARLMKAGFRQRTANFTLLLLVGLLFSEMAELAGLHAIVGAFLAGLFVREGVLQRKLSHDISGIVHDLSIGFLAPIFFVTSGFAVTFDVFRTDLTFLLLAIVVATVSKVVGVLLFYLPTRAGWREALTVGLSMNGRGGIDIILAQIGLSQGFIDQELFSVLVFMALFTTATVPFSVKWALGWLNRHGGLVREEVGEKRTMIFGAGPFGIALAKEISKAESVVVIDRNREHCNAATRAGLHAVSGDALQYETLDNAGASVSQRLIAVSSNPDVNSLVAQFARETFRMPEVFALIPSPRESGMHAMLAEQGIKPLSAGQRPIEEWERALSLGVASVEELPVLDRVSAAETADTWSFGRERLPIAVRRASGASEPFHDALELQAGDRIVYLHDTAGTESALQGDRFDRLVASADVLDVEEPLSRDEAFRRIAEHFAARLELPADTVRQLLLSREAQGGTMIAPGIAIPHLEVDTPGRLDAVILRAREGIVFEEGKPPVIALFAIATSRDERAAYLRVLGAIAQILHSSTFTQRWLELQTPDDLREFLRAVKRQRF